METKIITDVDYTNNTKVDLIVGEDKLLKQLPTNTLISEILERITDPDAFPINDSSPPTSSDIIPKMEVGGLDRDTGENSDRTDAVRTIDFVPIDGGKSYTFINGLGYKICIMLFDDSKALVTGWNGSYPYAYVKDNDKLSLPSAAKFFKFYCSDTADTTIKFKVQGGNSGGPIVQNQYLEFVKQYFSDGHYSIQCTEMDPGLYQLEISSKDNEFNILKIKAPETKPHEATLSLMLSGNDFKQFADLSSMRYDETVRGQVCLIMQSRSLTPLPYFFIGFNDGEGAGRIQKFRIDPDAIPMFMTKDGIRVRRNNIYDNEWAEEEVTINLATMYDKVEKMYAALVLDGTITE